MAKRRKPLYGSVEWVAAQAKEAGTTYGRYVAEMEPPAKGDGSAGGATAAASGGPAAARTKAAFD